MIDLVSNLSTNHTDMLAFWAKSGHGDDTAEMHSIAHHSLDVAAAAATLLPELRLPARIESQTLVALVALHDIGKFTRTFQANVPALWPSSLGPFVPPPAGNPHDATGYALLVDPLLTRHPNRYHASDHAA